MVTLIGEITSNASEVFLKMWKTQIESATRLYQEHRHSNYEIAMVLNGKGRYSTVNGIQSISKGDVFIFPSNEAHYILQIEKDGLEMVNLHFNCSFFQAACTISARYPNLFFVHSRHFTTKISSEDAGTLCILIENIVQELTQRRSEYKTVIHSLLNLIFAELVRSHGYYHLEEKAHTSIEKIASGLQFINMHYLENISLKEIAAQSALSPNYYTKLFKDTIQVRLWDYIISKRIETAKELLLKNGERNILEIALACGFNNTANFNRAFLKFTGVTPTEYKHTQDIFLY